MSHLSVYKKTSFLFLILLATRTSTPAEVPSFQEFQDVFQPSEFKILDRHGRIIHSLRTHLQFRNIEWVPLGQMSKIFIECVILSEDFRFSRHRGIDWLAMAGATWDRLFKNSGRGGSTITMQLVSKFHRSLQPKTSQRTILQKYQQIRLALKWEQIWGKESILEAYLNSIHFRGELQGVGSAARGLFRKDPSGLNLDESLILAVLIRSPQSEESKVLNRACLLGKRRDPQFQCQSLQQLIASTGVFPKPITPSADLAPHFARILSKKSQGRKKDFKSSLDIHIQKMVRETLRQQVLNLRNQNLGDAAAMVVENESGKVLAYVGSVGQLSKDHEVDGVRALRQAGSTLKPFLYAGVLEQEYLTLASLLDDSPLNIRLDDFGSLYRPQDFNRKYHGENITLRQALGSSLNIPAVRTLQILGVSKFLKYLKLFGFTSLKDEEYYGASLALGTADVSLWELVNAYRTLANHGVWSPLNVGPDQELPTTTPKVATSKGVAFLISDVLSDAVSRSLSFDFINPLSVKTWAAVKTGTSKDMRDNWCVGFSKEFTVGVWTGNFSGKPMWNVSGTTGAAPAWAQIMDALPHLPKGAKRPKLPSSVKWVRNEWYLSGTEPPVEPIQSLLSTGRFPKIIYPVEGLVISIDPDIPEGHQTLHLQANVSRSNLVWKVNSIILPNAKFSIDQPGTYIAQLTDQDSRVFDSVRFIVK